MRISVTHEAGVMRTLTLAGIDKMQDIFLDGNFITQTDLSYVLNQTPLFIFSIHRLRKALQAHYPTFPSEHPTLQPLHILLTCPTRHKLVTKLYKAARGDTPLRQNRRVEQCNRNMDPPLTQKD